MPEQMEVLAMAKMLSMVLVTYKSKQELKNEMWKLRQFGNHCKKYVELEKLGQFAIVNVKSFARFLVITVQTTVEINFSLHFLFKVNAKYWKHYYYHPVIMHQPNFFITNVVANLQDKIKNNVKRNKVQITK